MTFMTLMTFKTLKTFITFMTFIDGWMDIYYSLSHAWYLGYIQGMESIRLLGCARRLYEIYDNVQDVGTMRKKVFQYPNYNTHVVVRTFLLDGDVLWSLDVVVVCRCVLELLCCACNQYCLVNCKYV